MPDAAQSSRAYAPSRELLDGIYDYLKKPTVELDVPWIYNDPNGIPTISAGLALAVPDPAKPTQLRPWRREYYQGLLGAMGQNLTGEDMDSLLAAVQQRNNPQFQTADSATPMPKEPPFGIALTPPQSRAGVDYAATVRIKELRNRLGTDENGNYVWDQLQQPQQVGLYSVYHQRPRSITTDVVNAVQNDPDWQANVFRQLAFSDPKYGSRRLRDATQLLLGANPEFAPFGSDATAKAFSNDQMNAVEAELQGVRDQAPAVPPPMIPSDRPIAQVLPGSGDGNERQALSFAMAGPSFDYGDAGGEAPAEDALPVNLLNSNQLPANLFNTPPEEMRRFGLA